MGEEQVYKVTMMEENAEKEKETVVEEEEAGDCADPFEMLGGMGEEQVYQVTMLKENEGKKEEEEEEEAADCDDPFAMLGGMGEEQVYKVTMMEEKEEEAADCDTKSEDLEALYDQVKQGKGKDKSTVEERMKTLLLQKM